MTWRSACCSCSSSWWSSYSSIRKAGAGGTAGPADGHTVRRFFQYLVLYGLLVVVAVGLSGLLGRLLDRDVLVSADEAQLARDLAFTVVGVPLFAGVALWSRRRLADDPAEARSLGWAFYVTAASLTVAGHGDDRVSARCSGGPPASRTYDGRALASLPRVGRGVGHALVGRGAHHARGSTPGCTTSSGR